MCNVEGFTSAFQLISYLSRHEYFMKCNRKEYSRDNNHIFLKSDLQNLRDKHDFDFL